MIPDAGTPLTHPSTPLCYRGDGQQVWKDFRGQVSCARCGRKGCSRHMVRDPKQGWPHWVRADCAIET